MVVSTTKTLLSMSRTPTLYDVAPATAPQSSATEFPAWVGPGALVLPGPVLVGMAGIAMALGVWK